MATIALRQGQLPRVVGPTDSCSPQSSPPLSVRPWLSWLTSLPGLTLAGIRGSKPILDGPGWQPLTAQWTSDPQPRAVHRLYHKHHSAPSLESWNRTGECDAESPLKAMPWDYFAEHEKPKAAGPLMCFCKFQQIKKMCVQNSIGGQGLAFMKA